MFVNKWKIKHYFMTTMIRQCRQYTILRRLCSRWRCRCSPIKFFSVVGVVSLILSVTSFGYAFRHMLFDMLMMCEDQESLSYIADYCQAYREGQVTGSLCEPLCNSRQVRFQSCTNFHAGKRVSIMSCSDFCVGGQSVSAVLKYPFDNISSLLTEHPESFPDDSETGSFYQRTEEMIRNALKWELGFVPFPSDVNATERMWEKGSDKYTSSWQAQQVAFRSIMMLMDQTEYKVVKALENSGVVPRVYGTCGAMYLMEFCPPAVLDDAVVSYADPKHVPLPWKEKATAVIQLLHLILHLEQDFPEVLHLCDVKESNFGVCADGSMKLIDADSAFFDGRMMETFRTTKCNNHDACHFFDCGGWCQSDSGQCFSAITNNNLQTVCRDVLTSEIPKVLGGGSIFSGAPASTASKLQAVVEECLAHRATEQGQITVHKPPLSLLIRLIRLLQHSLLEIDQGL